jgi:D-alanyl-D-alanine carboxypeptidase/D-alanyl-D-alanine-endopeptidase (penicillin-binding protein 4)
MAIWARAKAGVHIVCADHSGLSDVSHISAADMVRLLTAPGVPGVLRPLLKRIAMLDARGDPMRGFAGAVVAKTGTLDFVTALAGYERSASGQQTAFAIFAENPERRYAAKAQGVDQPEGAAAWNARGKHLQQRLLQRWAMR